ncbi:MAG: NAD(P)-binding protein [Synechococcaceae cyanobacterium RL_1_2]|nr:NAD(P)-binding protein [Synechococcaceae cyanobacterium RL_1_2]
MANPRVDCLIVGGGLTGLIAATVLTEAGLTVTIADKGRGIGGRLATRRLNHPRGGQGIFDYGAQYFRATEPQFQRWVRDWLQAGIVTNWPALEQQKQSDRPIYRGIESNRHLAKHLAQSLTVHTNTRIEQLSWQGDHWTITSPTGELFTAHKLLLTAPVPQSLELLRNSAIVPTDLEGLERVSYYRCLALLVLLQTPATISLSGSLGLEDSPIAWISANDQKGISPDWPAVTIHASSDFTDQYWNDRETGAQQLLQLAHTYNFFPSSAIVDHQIHGWGYSLPKVTYGQPFYQEQSTASGPLWLAGDGFSSPQASCPVEGAFLSGLAVATAILQA